MPALQKMLLAENVRKRPFCCDVSNYNPSQCRTRQPNFKQFLFRHTIHDTEDSTSWMTDIKVNSIAVTFKVDTGAEVTAISEDTLQTLGQLEVNKTDKKL